MSALALVRWALYADLGVVFGVPAAALLTGARYALPGLRWALVLTSVAGLAFSMLGYLLLVSEMAGTGLADLDRTLAFDLATGSALGWAFLARLTALAVVTALWLSKPRAPLAPALLAAVAVASLAWSGHAAGSEGSAAVLRLGGDVLHLLASETWIGALALFAALLLYPSADPARHMQALARFSSVGSVLVAVLVATGLTNVIFLAPFAQWPQLVATPYGRILIAKLALFALMLALAALHRFRLVPRAAASRLQVSVSIELVVGLGVLLCVGLMGTLDPFGA